VITLLLIATLFTASPEYRKYLKSPEYKKHRKVLIKKREKKVGRCCEICGSKKSILPHHITYKRLKKEKISDYRLTCFWCHRELHRKKDKNDKSRLRKFNRLRKKWQTATKK
jgi:hypothetical protein